TPVRPPTPGTCAMAYDTSRGQTVAVMQDLDSSGGMVTWEWDGSTWVERAPGTTPDLRSRLFTYDPVRKRCVGVTTDGETWEWDGTAWPRVSGEDTALAGLAIAYDPARGGTILFSQGTIAQTWSWDGASWSALVPPAGPGTGYRKRDLAFDSRREKVIALDEE